LNFSNKYSNRDSGYLTTFKIKMATETERKFLVKGEFRNLAVRKIEILQRYLTIDNDKSIRIRVTNDDAYITLKARPAIGSISRNEWEYRVPVEEAMEMMSICLPGKIEKTRYIIPAGRHKFEVDEFHDKNEGLIVAEIELDYEQEEFERPEWLGEEVTSRPEYYNANLIR
jgi:adenylate cyclase